MLPTLILLLSLASPPSDPLVAAMESYARLGTYQVTLRSGRGDSAEIIRYSYKKPGLIRMDFIRPHKGALIIYDPATKKIRLRPFGFATALTLTLNPDNALVKSAQGHRVDQSDIGTLLGRANTLQQHGKAEILGEEAVGQRKTFLVSVEGEKDFALDGTHRFLLNLDETTWLPLKTRSYDLAGNLREEVLMDDLETDVQLDDAFFRP
ncbi:DUF1571 domain-containing protein [Fundidesulfovibrio terrae]|uniref:DUF1571 domain-containing protein n=1 Tax=Fundidesulfovibrio terrae TaxID=2922866 RepID=UPI001FAFCEEF|nr:DUF1571 domain-containing protein [Fundidesulfovibrio terrae]